MSESGERVTVSVEGRTVTLTNLDKVLYPATGTTKGEVLAYLAAVAAELLGQLARRPVTRVRWPHGTGDASFFEKNVPAGAPAWLERVTLDSPGSRSTTERVTYPLVRDLAGLTWLANLSALELHVPQWRVDASGHPLAPDRLVVDLDPGAPAGLAECARVALLARAALTAAGFGPLVPVTSGNKGLQLYAGLPSDGSRSRNDEGTRESARVIAEELADAHPGLVVAAMAKRQRHGKVFFDWSQNTTAKTTICPYSLRGKSRAAFVAAPRTWTEIEAGASGGTLRQLTPDQVVARLSSHGDLMEALAP
ncbi:MAG: non-homologous end-joining DNA ligase [Dermatophilaceae bacterium]